MANSRSRSNTSRVSTYKKSLLSLAALGGSILSPAFASADVVPFLRIDLNSAGSATFAGYNAMNFANDALTNTVNIDSNISVTVDRISTDNNRDRNSKDADALTNDFIFENNINNPIQVTLNGLTVGKEYSLKIYNHDVTANNGTSATWYITQDGTTETIGVKANTVNNSQSMSTHANTYTTYTFTAAAESVVLTGKATDRFVFLNGIALDEAYDPTSGYTRFDVNTNYKDGADCRIISPRSTELYVDNTNTSNTATATAPSGVTLTVTSEAVLNARTRTYTNPDLDTNLYRDFLFSSSKKPFTVKLDNLAEDAVYRVTVHSHDTSADQSAGIWTMTNADGDFMFSRELNSVSKDTSTWSFGQYFKPGTTSASMTAELNGKAYTMFNGLELQEISSRTADYTWNPGRAGWLADGKWIDKNGNVGVPAAGDICYVTCSDATAMNRDYWLESTNDTFPGTFVLASGSRFIFKSSATAEDMILDGGFLHHGAGGQNYTLNGNLFVASDSAIDIDDGQSRTLTMSSVLSGTGNLTVAGNGMSNAVLTLTAHSSEYYGSILPSKATIKLSGAVSSLGRGALNIPSNSKLELAGSHLGLHYVPSLSGDGAIVVTGNSRLDLASSEAQTYSGTITVNANQALHIGYTNNGDFATDLNLPNATLSLASGATLGLIHQSQSSKVTNFVIGTLNGEANSLVRASGNIKSSTSNYAALTVGQGNFAGVLGGTDNNHIKMRLIKNTDGTLTLSGANRYQGGTTIQAGKILLTGAGTLGTGTVAIQENAVLEFNTAESETPKQLTLTSANAVSGAGTVVKSGAGTMQVNNADAPGTFTAANLAVNAGKLEFSGSMAGDLTIGGTDTRGVFSPGIAVGQLTVDGMFSLHDGSTLLLEQNDNGMDLLVAEMFSMDPDSSLELIVGAPNSNEKYAIIQNSSSNFGEDLDVEFWTSLLTEESAKQWTLSVTGNTVYASLIGTVTPPSGDSSVPEPSTWVLLVLGAVGLCFARKKRA